uniref:Candidate secreted effector n=1 Tax=Meloidogyne incognita TaxID=6306 RepID=A0A914L607_MELIC
MPSSNCMSSSPAMPSCSYVPETSSMSTTTSTSKTTSSTSSYAFSLANSSQNYLPSPWKYFCYYYKCSGWLN